jgi:hypothetical protein
MGLPRGPGGVEPVSARATGPARARAAKPRQRRQRRHHPELLSDHQQVDREPHLNDPPAAYVDDLLNRDRYPPSRCGHAPVRSFVTATDDPAGADVVVVADHVLQRYA